MAWVGTSNERQNKCDSRASAASRGVRDPMLDRNRLFPAEPATRAVAAKLYETVRDLPILSPHGHTDPRWFAENKPFPNPAALFIQPDHYIFRMLYSQGISLESLGIPQVDGKEDADPREVWRIFARNYYLFRGTPTRLWLDYAFRSEERRVGEECRSRWS